MKIFIEVDENGKLTGWSSVSTGDHCKEIEVEEDHPLFLGGQAFRLTAKGTLVVDNGNKLNFIKEEKIKEFGEICQRIILGRFTVDLDGTNYHFSNDMEAQMNFDKMRNAFDKGMITELLWTAYGDSNEVVRVELNSDNFEKVYLAHLNHIQSNISRFRDILMPLVNASRTSKEVKRIHWDSELPVSEDPEQP